MSERQSAAAASADHANLAGRVMGDVHILPMRVYYEDTDASGIVYYANYLKFIERGRTDFLRLAGINHSELWREAGLAFTVRRCDLEYLKPARLDDEVEVHTRLTELRGASLWAEQSVCRDGTDLLRGRVHIACIARDGRPARLPPAVAAILKKLTNEKHMNGKRV